MSNGTTTASGHIRQPRDDIFIASGGIALIAAATIAGAWFFELVLDIRPCPLCLEQRYAYYLAIPLAALIALGASKGVSRRL
ncbi:MAG TPA: disulfide bond formation protein B, partial [Afipia sp.]